MGGDGIIYVKGFVDNRFQFFFTDVGQHGGEFRRRTHGRTLDPGLVVEQARDIDPFRGVAPGTAVYDVAPCWVEYIKTGLEDGTGVAIEDDIHAATEFF